MCAAGSVCCSCTSAEQTDGAARSHRAEAQVRRGLLAGGGLADTSRAWSHNQGRGSFKGSAHPGPIGPIEQGM